MNNELLTLQEHNLFGSTISEYSGNPYVPIIIQKGLMSVEDCNIQRRLEGKLDNIAGIYWGQKYLDCTMSLERLNLDSKSKYYGETLRDPALIEFRIPCEVVKDLSGSFPYARESIPRVEL